jgi:Putative prokaryotic signal transducing protein
MRPVLLTTDPVLLSFARAVLADSGIDVMIADQFTSAIEGSLGIFPRRLLVPDEAWHRARTALKQADLGHELVPDPDEQAASEGPEAWHGARFKR